MTGQKIFKGEPKPVTVVLQRKLEGKWWVEVEENSNLIQIS